MLRPPCSKFITMKYIDEFRNPQLAQALIAQIQKVVTRPHVIMEVCGGQTHAIVKYGIDKLLPRGVELVHGPGCPVCVTPVELIDKAVEIAALPHVIFCSFGDMLRVPGTQKDLFSVKAEGGDIRVVYSPLDALKIAKENQDKEVVFFAIGFETTAPGNAMVVCQAREQHVSNFSVLVSHVLVPPAVEAVLSSPENKVQGFLAAGHVCTVMGLEEYERLAEKYHVPFVITGFEPLDLLWGIYQCLKQLEERRYDVENAYARSVRHDGKVHAKQIMRKVFRIATRKWRGIGPIENSGYELTEDYAAYDAQKKFGLTLYQVEENTECISGLILRGLKKPDECPLFARSCSPEHPYGATMVSSEGACAAYYLYRARS